MAIIEMVDPGVEGVERAVKEYEGKYPEYADALRLYGEVMRIQQGALREVDCPLTLDDDEVEARLTSGVTIIEAEEFEIDPVKYRELVGKICAVMDDKRPGGFSRREELLSWEGLSDEKLPETKRLVLGGKELPLIREWENEADSKLVSNILWEALAPFYRKCGSIFASDMDQSLWQRGFCPVCGSGPLMGMFRDEDGLWLLECSLCHTLWNVQRARCPFCSESEGSLDYLYIEDDTGRRVQYCSSCKVYVKTVDLRESGREAVLPLEDIVTYELDLAAGREGLKPAAGRQ